MQIKIRYAKKQMKAARTMSANTLRDTLLPRMAISWDSRKAPRSSSGWRLLPSSLAKGTSIVKKQKERAFSLPGKLPAPNNPREFFVGIGSGSPLPLTKTYLADDLTPVRGTSLVRLYRQNWRTRSGVTHTSPNIWRSASCRWAANWLCVRLWV